MSEHQISLRYLTLLASLGSTTGLLSPLTAQAQVNDVPCFQPSGELTTSEASGKFDRKNDNTVNLWNTNVLNQVSANEYLPDAEFIIHTNTDLSEPSLVPDKNTNGNNLDKTPTDGESSSSNNTCRNEKPTPLETTNDAERNEVTPTAKNLESIESKGKNKAQISPNSSAIPSAAEVLPQPEQTPSSDNPNSNAIPPAAETVPQPQQTPSSDNPNSSAIPSTPEVLPQTEQTAPLETPNSSAIPPAAETVPQAEQTAPLETPNSSAIPSTPEVLPQPEQTAPLETPDASEPEIFPSTNEENTPSPIKPTNPTNENNSRKNSHNSHNSMKKIINTFRGLMDGLGLNESKEGKVIDSVLDAISNLSSNDSENKGNNNTTDSNSTQLIPDNSHPEPTPTQSPEQPTNAI
ncbi:MAG: hypothetical protein VKL59_19645 [Nostocaceae cyanobacterium]|nr:hypothetical protein [Nostocaceae cyanobacterium]